MRACGRARANEEDRFRCQPGKPVNPHRRHAFRLTHVASATNVRRVSLAWMVSSGWNGNREMLPWGVLLCGTCLGCLCTVKDDEQTLFSHFTWESYHPRSTNGTFGDGWVQ